MANFPMRAIILPTCGLMVFALGGCGERISNDLMAETYPTSFKAGKPAYLERDFEAGANFICDEIKQKRKHDFCADPDINWRR